MLVVLPKHCWLDMNWPGSSWSIPVSDFLPDPIWDICFLQTLMHKWQKKCFDRGSSFDSNRKWSYFKIIPILAQGMWKFGSTSISDIIIAVNLHIPIFYIFPYFLNTMRKELTLPLCLCVNIVLIDYFWDILSKKLHKHFICTAVSKTFPTWVSCVSSVRHIYFDLSTKTITFCPSNIASKHIRHQQKASCLPEMFGLPSRWR